MNFQNFPKDCKLIPTEKGWLLLSPRDATFCPIFPGERDAIEALLRNPETTLAPELENRLHEHGFGDGMRPMRPFNPLLQFQCTNACNLRCAYCSAESGQPRPNEIQLEDIKCVIDEGMEIFRNDLMVSFTGGEPLLAPWLFEGIDYAMEKTNNNVGLLSNLLLLHDNENLTNALSERMKRGLRVQMSIPGTTKEVCDRISGAKRFDRAIEVLHELYKRKTMPTLDLMFSAPDVEETISAFADFRRKLPPDTQITIGLIYPCGREKGELVFQKNEDAEAALDAMAFEGGVSIPAPRKSPLTNRREACHCIENRSLFIRSDGAIFSCFKMVEQLGHISEGLRKVQQRRECHYVRASDLPICKNCPLANICASGCHADNIILSQNTKAPICGEWRRKLLYEALFEDKIYILDWPVLQQLAEAKKRGYSAPGFIITRINQNNLFI